MTVVVTVPTSSDLVGRVKEFDELRAALAMASEGSPVTVLLGGEAGVGKTRLVTEFATHAATDDARVVFGQCVELGDGGLPFAPIVGVMRELVAQLGAEQFLALAGPGREAITRLLPELGAGTADIAEGRGRLLEVVAVVLERVSADRPLVLVIEDIHWADRSTGDLLRFVVRALRSARVLIVGTYRSDEVGRFHRLRPVLAELDRLRHVRRIDLPRLSRSEVAELLAGLLGHQLEPAVVANIHERSEGNPFIVEELASAGADTSLDVLPDSLRDILLARSEQLSDSAQAVLRLLAIGGNRVDHALLAAVADLDDVALDDALREAVSAGVLRVDGDGYAFRHALLREVLHEDILPGAHARYHVSYAEAIEKHPELAAGSASIAIAHHWYNSHDHERAFQTTLRAAEDATRAYAYADAQKMLEKALDLWDRVSEPMEVSGGDRVDLLARAARVASDAGELERVLVLAEAALDEPVVGSDPNRMADLAHLQAKASNNLGRRGDEMKAVRRALDLIPAEPPSPERAQLLARLAGWHMCTGRYEKAVELAEEAVAMASSAGAREPEFQAQHVRASLLAHLGRDAESGAVFESARQLAGDDPRMLVSYHANYSDSLNLLGRYAEAAQVARQGVDIAREIGLDRSLGSMLSGNAAEPLIALGEWDEAERLVTRALDLDPPARHLWQLIIVRARLSLWRGDLTAAAQAVNEVSTRTAGLTPGPQYTVPLATVAAELALAQGDPEAAWQHVRVSLDEPRDLVTAFDFPLLAVGARAVAARARGADAAAQPDARRVLDLADHGRDWAMAPVWRAVVTAELAGAAGDDAAAWQDVLDAVDSAGGPVHLRPYARYRLAKILIAAGDRSAASDVLQEAAEAADTIGAGLVRGWVADLSRRANVPLPNQVAADGDTRLGLTGRELEVLRLVAAGRSNREIGAELFISAKTASVHVSNILTKLGVSGRGEAAAVAHRRGLA